jgi:hypothetical protein
MFLAAMAAVGALDKWHKDHMAGWMLRGGAQRLVDGAIVAAYAVLRSPYPSPYASPYRTPPEDLLGSPYCLSSARPTAYLVRPPAARPPLVRSRASRDASPRLPRRRSGHDTLARMARDNGRVSRCLMQDKPSRGRADARRAARRCASSRRSSAHPWTTSSPRRTRCGPWRARADRFDGFTTRKAALCAALKPRSPNADMCVAPAAVA